MKHLTSLMIACSPWVATAQMENLVTLTLVEEDGFNLVDVALASALGNSDTTEESKSTLSGTIEARLNISPDTGLTDELTILSADISGSDVLLTGMSAFGNFTFTSDGLGLTANTPNAPGVVTAATGDFDGSQHQLIVNRGSLDGFANVPFVSDEPIPISYNYGTNNYEQFGTGTGMVELTPTVTMDGKQFYTVTVEIPVDLAQAISGNGFPAGVTANATITGRVKAIGTTFVELTGYARWASLQGLPQDSQHDFTLKPDIPNRLLWALGFKANTAPASLFTPTETGFQLNLGEGTAQEEVTLEWSTNLNDWDTVPNAAMISGGSLIEVGDFLDEVIIIGRGDGTKRFARAR